MDYASTLKRIKRKAFETTWCVEHFEKPEWWNDIPTYRINDIGDIFNYHYLIFWEGDSDDYKWGEVEVSIKPSALRKFKRTIKELLPSRSRFSKVDKLEILTELSPSIAFDSRNRKKVPHYQLKNKRLFFSEKLSPVKRSVIQVGPENYRDSVILDPADLNTISLIDRQIMEILREMPGHIHLRDKDRVSKRLRNLYKKCTYFLQRDLRKEGITKPRELLRVILEALNEEYPDIEIFGYTSFYDRFELVLEDGSSIFPKRGH